ncbi:hypothetical protein [Massilicoli timonensis]|uniref:Lipoprotein n=1 Tax=Massilicoli timonensis TaxID=2015901 RepID=A0ABT1SKE0_9FIRM|nr:hypothetical protein [Massilicoli timonensis]MCQ5121698.1 hypothetical protein [Massilicoli timonensis]
MKKERWLWIALILLVLMVGCLMVYMSDRWEVDQLGMETKEMIL